MSTSPICPHCGCIEKQVKNGYSVSGIARFKCQSCSRTYATQSKPRGYDPKVRLQAVKMYVDGINFRRIGRLLGVHHQSVINWVRRYATGVNSYHQKLTQQIPNFPQENTAASALKTQPNNERTQSRSLEVIEGDELFTFVTQKKTESI